MSRIGKMPIPLGDKVKAEVKGQLVKVTGPKFTQEIPFTGPIEVTQEDGSLTVKRQNDEPKTKALHGLYRTLINNAVVGVTTGWSKSLVLNGVGYRAAVSGSNLELTLGYSHPIKFPIPKDIEINVVKQTTVNISGPSKEQVGAVAAKVRGFRPPEPFLGKGVKYSDEVIVRKAGKTKA